MVDKLEEMYQKFISDDNIEEKMEMYHFMQRIYPFYKNNPIFRKYYKMIKKIMFKYRKTILNYEIDSFNSYKDFIDDHSSELLFLFNDINFDKIDIEQEDIPVLPQYTLLKIIDDFFQSTDINLYNYYLDIFNKHQIIITNSHQNNNFSYMLPYHNDITYIFIDKLENIVDVSILIHEIGHSYYNYVNQKEIPSLKNKDNYLKDEIPAMFLELLFIKYIFNVSKDNGKILYNNYYDCLNSCISLVHHTNSFEYMNCFKYLMGNVIGMKFLSDYDDNKIDILKIYHDISSKNIFQILKDNNISNSRIYFDLAYFLDNQKGFK